MVRGRKPQLCSFSVQIIVINVFVSKYLKMHTQQTSEKPVFVRSTIVNNSILSINGIVALWRIVLMRNLVICNNKIPFIWGLTQHDIQSDTLHRSGLASKIR